MSLRCTRPIEAPMLSRKLGGATWTPESSVNKLPAESCVAWRDEASRRSFRPGCAAFSASTMQQRGQSLLLATSDVQLRVNRNLSQERFSTSSESTGLARNRMPAQDAGGHLLRATFCATLPTPLYFSSFPRGLSNSSALRLVQDYLSAVSSCFSVGVGLSSPHCRGLGTR